MIFEPLLPGWGVLVAALALAATVALFVMRDPRTGWTRAIPAALILLVIANPVSRREIREQRDDVGLILVDRSRSMEIGDRRATAERAAAALRQYDEGIEWRVAPLPQQPGQPTRLGEAVEQAVGAVEPDRLGAVFVVTDGISADAPPLSALPSGVPLHQLLAGDPALVDRRLVIESVPPFTVTGQEAELSIRVDDPNAESVPVEVRTSDGERFTRTVPANEAVTLPVTVDQRGRLDVALSVPVTEGEATAVNNRALATVNGVTDRLSVLLVSGQPYPGGRVWRDLFKADPNVDLVHFTILRLPSSYDPTSPDDLALIPFPVDELFQERLGAFDLIIFDRFDLTQLMSPGYFFNLAERVEGGGGLLVVAGPEYGDRDSIAFTALDRVLPALPAGEPVAARFRPSLTETGTRHPVTRALPQRWGGTGWGEWGEMASVRSGDGAPVLMRGVGDRPLLVLDRVGEGRVGLLASTDIWWWARAVAGAGPREELLRRIAHWLMQEPDLDEEQLRVASGADELNIYSDSVDPLRTATVIGPGGQRREVQLNSEGEAVVPARETGLYRVEAGSRARFALVGDAAELSELRPRRDPLAAVAEASGGSTFWMSDGVPAVRRVAAGEGAAGGAWAGVRERNSGALIAVERSSLIPPWAAFLAIAGTLALSWWRERN